MADLRYRAIVETAQGQRNIQQLENTVKGLNDTFGQLKTAIAGIAIGNFITQSIDLAARLDTLGQVTGIATANLRGFQQAVSLSGGNADKATDAISDLVKNVGEAANGSGELVKAFSQVGVSFNDLDKLPMDQILGKVINGLAGIEDKAVRSSVGMKLMGEAVKTVDFTGVAGSYGSFSAQSTSYAIAAENARKAQDKMVEAMDKLRSAVVEALSPITEFISQLNISGDAIRRFVQAALAVGAALLSWTIIGRVARLIQVLWASMGSIIVAFSEAGAMIVNLVRNFGMLIANAGSSSSALRGMWVVIKAVAATIGEALSPAFTVLKTLALPILSTLVAYWGYVQDSTAAALRTLREYASAITFGLISPPSAGAGAGRGDGQAELAQRKKDAEEQASRAAALLKEQAKAAALIGLETRQYVQNLAIGLSRKTEELNLEANLLSLTEKYGANELEIFRAQNQNDTERLDAVRSLQQQREKLILQAQYANEVEKTGLNAQIAGLDERIKKTNEYYNGQNESIRYYLEKLQSARYLEEIRLKEQERIKQVMQDQIDRANTLSETLRGLNQQQSDVDFAGSLLGMGSTDKQIAQIKRDADKAAQSARDAFAGTFKDREFMSESEVMQLVGGLDQINEKYKKIAQSQIANLQASREWSVGWKSAWEEYKDNATNYAKDSADSFNKFTSGMEDALTNFIMTGKLSFKDLAQSILADLARIAAKRAIVFFASKLLPGLASGGPAAAGQPYVVGENGPELFVPKTAGTVIPNNQLTSSGGQVSGLGQTNVSYNIQAVDAASFRSLVARDPSFIYAVTEQGRRSQPARSR